MNDAPRIKSVLGNRLLVERVVRQTSPGGILFPDGANDPRQAVGPQLYRVLKVGPKVEGIEAGDRVLCYSYTNGPVLLDGQRAMVDQGQVLLVFPASTGVPS